MIPISDINPAKNVPVISRIFIIFSSLTFLFLQPKNNIDLLNYFYKYAAIPCELINNLPISANQFYNNNCSLEPDIVIFPDKNILRVDSDNISSKSDLKDFIKKANNNEIDIFIGTQMIVKGHDFEDVSLVGIINIDAGLYSTDFRGLEKTGQLITQVSGRAGRQKIRGNVIIQTNNPKHELLQKILREGYEKFSKVALKQRQAVNLPPYSHIGVVKVSCSIRQLAKMTLVNAAKLKKNKSIFVYGPAPSQTSKKNNQYFYQIIIGSESSSLLSKHITRIKLYLSSMDKRIKWYIDIDPIEQ